MFCYQCEQTAKGTGCASRGTCGKTPEVADLQDALIQVALAVAASDAPGKAKFLEDALFSTVTNVSFDADRVEALIRDGIAKIAAVGGSCPLAASASREEIIATATNNAIIARTGRLGADAAGLQELLTYGLKGMAAYGHHARVLGFTSDALDAFMAEALAFLTRPAPSVEELFGMIMKAGEVSLVCMELLDRANNSRFGTPTPTKVSMGHRAGKAILVSGHDLQDLEKLLQMTEGKGINIYTHGEMLPAHGYPELNKYPHLAGHYGDAWQHQLTEFDAFPGAILMTTNCLMPPRASYQGRLFTTGLVAHPDVRHVANGEFAPVIEAALAAPGFAGDEAGRDHIAGFGHGAVLGVADTVIEAVKTGAIKRFVVIGGCNGATGDFPYYGRLAKALPQDWVVLTLGCGKFQVLGNVEGSIGGIPRLLDMGQCNDSYSAIKVAGALAEAFNCGVNDLPLSLVLSWFEQKAVAVLLALLHLGVRNIRIGPKLPAFITPAVLEVLSEKFNVMAIDTVEGDIAAMAAGH